MLHDEMAHVPVAHVAAAFAREQPALHAPQFVSDVSAVSQPLASIPSQLPYPGLQVTIWQLPVPQLAVALAREHPTPQPPQLASEVSAVSQPFSAFMSQLPNPVLHAPSTQLPVAQLAVAFARAQATPHVPQFAVVVRGASQPFAAFMSQLPNPALHAPSTQLPVAQLEVAFERVHDVPQVPQLAAVVSGASHPLAAARSQFPKPALQLSSAQLPVEQLAVALARAHGTPHAPQLASVVSGASQPFADIVSQSSNPALHDAIRQLPDAHVGVAFARVHAVPQLLQFVSVVSDDSQPLDSFMSQLPKLGLHVASAHVPVAHVAEPLDREHEVPQAPQFASVVSGVSQPLAATRSQSPKPALHDTTWQLYPEQLPTAFAGAHTVAHEPQFASPSSEVSQPFARLMSQSA